MATEKLKFKLELYATMWHRAPQVAVRIGDKTYFSGDVTETEQHPKVIEFEHEFNEGEESTLVLDRAGKTRNETVVDAEGKIIKDQLLNIKSISIDEIDLGALVFQAVYRPQYAEEWHAQQKMAGIEHPETFKNVTSMGHNGTWTFHFASPFYMWLLENLY